ncbi:MAG: class I SAM-dependent methyltransferase [Defluviitaleaceae bacterium]|nr:class I SAM-dependent methyltransferase [Defluviitaleaceae bacterium]
MLENDVKFILSAIGDEPKRVLEVGCGDGRILVPLAQAGHDVTGFDVNKEDLDGILSKAEKLKNIRWHRADAVHDDWGSGFDVVVLAGNILFNIEGIKSAEAYKQAQELFIQKAASALVPDGYIYIDYFPFAPNGRTLLRSGQSCTDESRIYGPWEYTNNDCSVETHTITSGSFDEETGILRFRRFIERRMPDGETIMEESERIKHYATLEHLHKWLCITGFVIELEYEGFDESPITENSNSVVVYARKK